MKRFMYVFRGGEAASDASPEQMQANMQRWQTYMGELAQKGKLQGGEPLYPAGSMLSGVENTVVTDGPYAEGKELVGGYLIVNAESLAEATEMAKTCPALENDGLIEVREIRELSDL